MVNRRCVYKHYTSRPVLNLSVTDSYKFLPAALMDWIMLKPSQNQSTPSWLRKHIPWAAFRLNFLAHLSARLLFGSTDGLCKKSVYLSFSSAIRLYRLYPSLKYSLGGSSSSILSLTIHHCHSRTYLRCRDRRCNDPCRVHAAILLPVGDHINRYQLQR